MLDRVRPDEIAADGETVIACISPTQGRDADSVWVLRTRPIRIGRLLIVPAEDDTPGAIRLVDSADSLLAGFSEASWAKITS